MSLRGKLETFFRECKDDIKQCLGRRGSVPPAPDAPAETSSDPISAMRKGLNDLKQEIGSATDLSDRIKELVAVIEECVDTYEMTRAANVECDGMRAQLEATIEDLRRYFEDNHSPAVTESMLGICGSIKEELKKVQTKLGRNLAVRYLEAPDEVDAIVGCYRRIESHLRRLTLNVNIEVWKVVEEQAAESRFDRLPSVLPARYNSAEGMELKRRPCTAGTRVDVLANILHWTSSRGEGAVYWLNGMAGTGKTTIAYSLCTELDALHHLGASFFCSLLREECRNANMIIPSIAYQLARFSLPFKSALSKVLENDPDVHGRLPQMQFEALIAKPMLEVQNTLPEGLTVVIDALEECEQMESTARMLDVLLTKSANLPIKFIVSSRPEPQFRDQMTEERAKSILVLHELDKVETQEDIEKYLRESLAPMSPSDAQIAALAWKAGILFIYAVTAVRYIGFDNFQSDPEGRLGDILDGQQSDEDGEAEIDKLYMKVLEAALDNRRLRKSQREDMRQVLFTVICAQEPLTTQGLSNLLGMEDVERVLTALRPLWSVLQVGGFSGLVTALHPSFLDFVFDSYRSKNYSCDFNAHNRKLAEHCLELIARTKPQFNICGLESSFIPDEQIPDIERRVANAIPSELLYVCRYWADHVHAANCAPSVIEHIRDFLSTRLLLWMEILNLQNQVKAGMECVKLLTEWCKAFEGEQELAELAYDAKRFVEAFALNPVSRSTPHIYVSMLAFWPKSAPIAKHYAKYTHGPVVAEGSALDRRQLALLSTWAFPQSEGLIVVSPDGQHVALVTGNDILVVDSSSGKVVLGPLKGHPNQVKAIAFSPDGSRILAGSFSGPTLRSDSDSLNATILGWGTRSGDTVLGPLQIRGHTSNINCLSFSPDCFGTVTGSNDKTVRLWNAQTGEALIRLEAHDPVRVAVFSPDGTGVAAGFGNTLQMWDSQSGDTTLGPVAVIGLDSIDLIALSPDNSRLICAHTYNKIIQAAHIQGGDVVFQQIAEHPADVNCIAYSPDNKYIVSGSHDRALRVWDTESGKMVLGPLEAHTGIVNSVAFSPDGSRIISAYEGGVVRTWDAQPRSPIPVSTNFNLPLHRITCAKFSSDGARFVTGSLGRTISIWDTDTGEVAIGPIEFPASQINAVDFNDDRIVLGPKGGRICVCDARSGEVVMDADKAGSRKLQAIANSPDGNLITTGSSVGVEVWNAQDGSWVLGPLTDLRGDVWSVQFSPDGSRIVASSDNKDPNIVVWDVSDGRNVFGTLDGHDDSVRSVSYSPNGAFIASGSDDCTIIIWNADTGAKAIGPLTGHPGWVFSVCFSPDSTRLVSGSDDETILIWDVQTGQMLFELSHGHEHWVRSVEYSPDGTRFLSLSGDMSVRIHDARSPEERAKLHSESEVGDWRMRKDGWVVDDQSRLLVWVPSDLRKALWPSTLQIKVPRGNDVWLKFDKSRMGESWAQSYIHNM